jgi:hypothetical protein
LSTNTALKNLYCSANKITSLDVTTNLDLIVLDCASNKITNLDVSQNGALNYFFCNDNLLTSLNITGATSLLEFSCYNNQLTTLDLITNVNVTAVNCGFNKITNLDLTQNIALEYFSCNDNLLTLVNLRNGKNTLLNSEALNMTNNPNLTCILVDVVAYSNTNWSTKKDSGANYKKTCIDRYTLIPDLNFENALIEKGIDSGTPDGRVLTDNVELVTILDVSKSNIYSTTKITSLTGIQDFENLTGLDCSRNALTTLDLSKNKALVSFYCGQNDPLETINLQNGNNKLWSAGSLNLRAGPSLYCILVDDVEYSNTNWMQNKESFVNFSSVCGVPQYTLIPDAAFEKDLIEKNRVDAVLDGKVLTACIAACERLSLSTNLITDLTGLRDFTSLTYIYAVSDKIDATNYWSKLTTIDLSQCPLLDEFYGKGNQFKTIDFSNNPKLRVINLESNPLTTLDVSHNLVLETLNCKDNKLTSLDVSANVALTRFTCASNKLTSLNLKNGKNELLITASINFTNNPTLSCIQVDDLAYSNTNWVIKKDATAFYTELDCSSITTIPDSKFEDKLIALNIDADGKNGFVVTSSINMLKTLDVSLAEITNLTGIQSFEQLETLNCSGNSYTSLDFSKNTTLKTLDVSKNAKLETIDLRNGKNALLTTVDFKTNSVLSCVLVDNATYATTTWSAFKDANVTFSEDCSKLGTAEQVFHALSIYPNPTNGQLNIDNVVLEKATVYDALGKLVKSVTFQSGANNNTLDLSGMTKGIYFVYLQSEGANTARKIVVE